MQAKTQLSRGDEEAKQRAVTFTVMFVLPLFAYNQAFHFPWKYIVASSLQKNFAA